MRILLVTDNYLPHMGGSRVYMHNLLLRMGDVEATVLTRSQQGDVQFDAAQPYRVRRVPLEERRALAPLRLQFLPVYVRLLREVRRLLNEQRPDVLVAGEITATGVVCAFWSLLRKTPLVLVTHAEGPRTIARTRVQSRLARWAIRRASAVVAASPDAQESCIRLFGAPPGKVHVVLPAAGDMHFDPAWKARPFQNPAAPVRLLCVGRLIPRKGHLVAVEALKLLAERLPQRRFEFIIAGGGPLAAAVRSRVAELGLQGRVRLTGKIDETELLRLYRDADCFLMPNRDDPKTGDTEGFGIVFGEAAAHGLPAVGGRAGGTRHAIIEGETGFRVDGEDPQAVCEALTKLIENPALARRFGAAAVIFARTRLRWDARAEAFEKVLDSVAPAAAEAVS